MPSLSEEYEVVQRGVGFFFLPDVVLRFQGPDLKTFLQGSLSNDVRNLKPGQGLAACHLDAKGRLVAALKCFEREAAVWVNTSAGEASNLQKSLQTLLLFSETELEDLSRDYVWVLATGVRASDFVRDFFQVQPQNPLSHQSSKWGEIPVEVIRDFQWVSPAFLILLPRSYIDAFKIETERSKPSYPLQFLQEALLEILRIESGIPAYGKEIDEKILPPEIGLDEAWISYTKGCYVGQETISRIKHYGRVNKSLVSLLLKTEQPASGGEKVFLNGKEVGRITSSAHSLRWNSPIALALLRREAAQSEEALQVERSEGGAFEAVVIREEFA